jgi:predicted HD phosphohydrolase
MQDRYRKRYRVAAASGRVRQQIALEAARRIYKTLFPARQKPPQDWLETVSAADLYAAKRKAAAVLGHRIRPGDLPSDAEIREQLIALWRDSSLPSGMADDMPEPEPEALIGPLAEHLDRFAIYRMRLEPLEEVKQNPKQHPEGDALFHSLQVFHLARDIRPYDEEFLLAALLHDVGLAIDPEDHVAAGVHALRGSVTERTLWLIEHHMDRAPRRERALSPKLKRELDESEYAEDLRLLRELDEAGRVPGERVDTLDEVFNYLKGLEHESYLND